jgi:CRP-like cAMP-binding protein/HEAT repeat protein
LDSSDLETLDAGSLQTLEGYLSSNLPEEVIYAVNMLQSFAPANLEKSLPALLDHPSEQVRRQAFDLIERQVLCSALPQVERRLIIEQNSGVRAAAVQAYARLEECGDHFEKVSTYLDDPDPLVQRGAMVGLLHSGGIAGVLAAGQNLLRLAQSVQPEDRVTAAQTLEKIGASRYYQPLVPLLHDTDPGVQRAALSAACSLKNPRLWPIVIELLDNHPVRNAAAAALTHAGEAVLPALFEVFSQPGQTHPVQEQILRICGRIGSPASSSWLFEHISSPDGFIRTHTLRALNFQRYRAEADGFTAVVDQIHAETSRAAELLAILRDIGHSEEIQLINHALLENLDRSRERIFLLLALLFDRRAVLGARDNLNLPSPEKRAYAMEVLDVLIPGEIKRETFLFLTDSKVPGRASEQLLALFPQNEASLPQRLVEVIASPPGRFSSWTQACALYSAGSMKTSVLSPIAIRALNSPNPLLRETAIWTLHRLDGVRAREHTSALVDDRDPFVSQTARQLQKSRPEVIVLTTIEKVLALKKTSIFIETPDEVLLQVAPLLEERRVEAGGRVIEKDDMGDCMYILVDGEMRVHDGDRTLNFLSPGAAFGEIAVLDTEPRTASVTAQSSSLLLRLAQESLYEAMDAHPQVARGIIRALSHSLRARVQDVQQLRAKLENQVRDANT